MHNVMFIAFVSLGCECECVNGKEGESFLPFQSSTPKLSLKEARETYEYNFALQPVNCSIQQSQTPTARYQGSAEG
jgi:hypothetical protein